jgi:hypothetical protein
MKRTLLAIIVGMVGLTACGSAHSLGTVPPSPAVQSSASPSIDPSTSKPPKPKPTTTNPAPSQSPTPCATKTGGYFDPKKSDVGAQVVDVRLGSHDTYDRVTFEFSGQDTVPPYTIRTVTTVTEDGSGKTLSLQGTSYAELVFQHASGYDLYYQPTYKGPKDFVPKFQALAEVREAGDFERVLSWGFGLNDSSCWHVLELSNPVRLAVDFSH